MEASCQGMIWRLIALASGNNLVFLVWEVSCRMTATLRKSIVESKASENETTASAPMTPHATEAC